LLVQGVRLTFDCVRLISLILTLGTDGVLNARHRQQLTEFMELVTLTRT
jgi:hypothetical protein